MDNKSSAISDGLKEELSLELTNRDTPFTDYEMSREAISFSVNMTLDILGIGNNSNVSSDK